MNTDAAKENMAETSNIPEYSLSSIEPEVKRFKSEDFDAIMTVDPSQQVNDDKLPYTKSVSFLSIISESDKKKIVLDDSEKSMAGAPEGEIFHAEVLEDTALIPLSSEALDQLLSSISSLDNQINTGSWFHNFMWVETFRRLLHHHNDIATNKVLQTLLLPLVYEAVNSLRSVEVRNGIMAMETLLITHHLILDELEVSNCMVSLVQKSSSGPKFLSELAFTSICKIIQSIPCSIAVATIAPMVTNKNFSIAGQSAIILSKCVDTFTIDIEHYETTLTKLLTALSQGLKSKKTDAKVACKAALLRLIEIIGKESFSEALLANVGPTAAAEVEREVEKTAGKTVSSKTEAGSSTGDLSSKSRSGASRKFSTKVIHVNDSSDC